MTWGSILRVDRARGARGWQPVDGATVCQPLFDLYGCLLVQVCTSSPSLPSTLRAQNKVDGSTYRFARNQRSERSTVRCWHPVLLAISRRESRAIQLVPARISRTSRICRVFVVSPLLSRTELLTGVKKAECGSVAVTLIMPTTSSCETQPPWHRPR